MNIYCNSIINRLFKYCGSTYQVASYLEYNKDGTVYRTCVNVATGAKIKLSYAQMWNVVEITALTL